MDKSSIIAIGETTNVLLYNSLGIKSFITSVPKEIDRIIFEEVKKGCKIVFIAEALYPQITETLDKYAKATYPLIISLPIDELSTGAGDERIKENVEKAIGVNIF